jgi:hypothetical protein
MASSITIEGLIGEYAVPIAGSVGLAAAEYDRTAEGLASLLRDTADRLGAMDQIRDWLEEAAADLEAVARLGDGGSRTQELLDGVDTTLYEARTDLELV